MNNNEYILELITETNKKLKEVSIKINLELPQDKHPTDEEICFAVDKYKKEIQHILDEFDKKRALNNVQ